MTSETVPASPRRRGGICCLALAILALGGVLRAWSVGEPIEGGWHAMGLCQAAAARNHIRYGIVETSGLMILNGAPAHPNERVIYARHPPLLPHLHAIGIRVFGDSLETYRGTLILLSLLSVLGVMVLVGKLHGAAAGLLAGTVLSVCPHEVFWATGGDALGPGIGAFMVLGLIGRLLIRPRFCVLGLLVEALGYTAAALFDWPGFLTFGIPLLFATFRSRTRRALKEAGWFLAVGISLFLAFTWWTGAVLDAFPGFVYKSHVVDGGSFGWSILSMGEMLGSDRFGEHIREFLLAAQLSMWTLPVATLLALSILVGVSRWLRRRPRAEFPLLLTLWGVPALFLVAFLRVTLVHAFSAVLLAPAIGATAGMALGRLWHLELARRRVGILLVGAWLAWFGLESVPRVDALFTSRSDDGLAAAAERLTAMSKEKDLVLAFDRDPYSHSYLLRRNVVSDVRKPVPSAFVERYLPQNPGARMFYLLPPRPSAKYPVERAQFDVVKAILDRLGTAEKVGDYRIYHF